MQNIKALQIKTRCKFELRLSTSVHVLEIFFVIYDMILRLVYTFSAVLVIVLYVLILNFLTGNHVVIFWQLLFNLRRRSIFVFVFL